MHEQNWIRRPRPANEREVVRFVASCVKEDITEQELEDALAARGVKAARSSLRSAIEAGDKATVEEALGDADASIIDQGVDEHEARKTCAKRPRTASSAKNSAPAPAAASSTTTTPSSSTPVVDASAAASTSASSHSGGPAGPRVIEGEEFTRDQGRAFLPEHRRFLLVIHTGKAWLVKDSERSTAGHRSRTATWGGYTGRSHRAALLECVRWAWERYVEDNLGKCPYDLSK